MDGEYFWNICEIWEEESTREGARGGHEAGGAPAPLGAPLALVAPRKAVAALLWPPES